MNHLVRSDRRVHGIDSTVVIGSAGASRPVHDISLGLEYERFVEDARAALETLRCKEVVTKMGDNTVLVRMSPYRSVENHIEGLAIAFLDVGALMQSLQSAGLPVSTARAPELEPASRAGVA